jgi:hypothetical protein
MKQPFSLCRPLAFIDFTLRGAPPLYGFEGVIFMFCCVGPESTLSLTCGFNLRPLNLVGDRKVDGRNKTPTHCSIRSFSMARKYAY